jgi:hypothetical protein
MCSFPHVSGVEAQAVNSCKTQGLNGSQMDVGNQGMLISSL